MLVVMRRMGEEVVITLEDGREIIVTTIGIERNRVRMGIKAPRTIEVDRREIWEKKRGEVDGNAA